MDKMDLEKSFLENVETPEETEREGFVVDSLEKAEWAAKMYALRMQRIEEIKEYAKEKVDKILEWAESETRPLRNDAEYFQGILQPYAIEEVKRLKKGKSFKLPNGVKLGFKKAQPTYNYNDEELIMWLGSNGYEEFIANKPKLKWKELKEACIVTEDGRMVTNMGDIIEGVTVEPAGDDTFSVDIKGMK